MTFTSGEVSDGGKTAPTQYNCPIFLCDIEGRFFFFMAVRSGSERMERVPERSLIGQPQSQFSLGVCICLDP